MGVQCPQCVHVAKTQDTFRKHLLLHKPDKSHKCTLCDAEFHRAVSLRNHIAGAHQKEFAYKCGSCDFKTNVRFNFIAHEKTQHTETANRPFSCNLCNENFKTAYVLKNHILAHDKKRPSVLCQYCGKAYKSSGSLHVHTQNIHHGRTFACTWPECQRRFTQKAHQESHLRRHVGDRPFKCEKCCDSFYDRRDLRNHMHSFHTEKGIQVRKKKEQHCHDWLTKNGFDQVVRNQRVDLRCKEKTANWIELDFYIHRASDDTVFVLELGNHFIFKTS